MTLDQYKVYTPIQNCPDYLIRQVSILLTYCVLTMNLDPRCYVHRFALNLNWMSANAKMNELELARGTVDVSICGSRDSWNFFLPKYNSKISIAKLRAINDISTYSWFSLY